MDSVEVVRAGGLETAKGWLRAKAKCKRNNKEESKQKPAMYEYREMGTTYHETGKGWLSMLAWVEWVAKFVLYFWPPQ